MYICNMKLVMNNVTTDQKDLLLRLAGFLQISVEVVDATEDEEDKAMMKAIHSTINDEAASAEEVTAFRHFLRS